MIKPISFHQAYYPVTLDYKRLVEDLDKPPIITYSVKDYIRDYNEREGNNMKDYIVVHDDNNIGIILKKAIAGVSKTKDSTIIYFDGNAFYCDDKYEDIVKQILV